MVLIVFFAEEKTRHFVFATTCGNILTVGMRLEQLGRLLLDVAVIYLSSAQASVGLKKKKHQVENICQV